MNAKHPLSSFSPLFPISQPRLKCHYISLEEMAPGPDPAGNKLMKKRLLLLSESRWIPKTWGIQSHKKGIPQSAAPLTRTTPIWSHVVRRWQPQALFPHQSHFPPLPLSPPKSNHPHTGSATETPALYCSNVSRVPRSHWGVALGARTSAGCPELEPLHLCLNYPWWHPEASPWTLLELCKVHGPRIPWFRILHNSRTMIHILWFQANTC